MTVVLVKVFGIIESMRKLASRRKVYLEQTSSLHTTIV